MSEIILHHYEMSPYAEKLRLIFGLKGLAWRSVQIPVVMPKPDLTELTGGYRRTPVLQIGADVYCDTKLCARVLERLHPSPSLFPYDETTVWALAHWAETSFMMAVIVFLGAGGLFDAAFIEDRKKMAPHLDFAQTPKLVPSKLLQLRANLDRLEQQLSDGRAFLLGADPCLADFAAHHAHAFLRVLPQTAALLEPLAHVPRWMERVQGFGHGTREELTADEAIAIARAAKPAASVGAPVPLPEGLAPGDAVVVVPEETGSGTVQGELLPSEVHEIAIRRHSDRAGELVVHFPREETLVMRAG